MDASPKRSASASQAAERRMRKVKDEINGRKKEREDVMKRTEENKCGVGSLAG
jgi:hypothetical protein